MPYIGSTLFDILSTNEIRSISLCLLNVFLSEVVSGIGNYVRPTILFYFASSLMANLRAKRFSKTLINEPTDSVS